MTLLPLPHPWGPSRSSHQHPHVFLPYRNMNMFTGWIIGPNFQNVTLPLLLHPPLNVSERIAKINYFLSHFLLALKYRIIIVRHGNY
jgi:hypothetical protein